MNLRPSRKITSYFFVTTLLSIVISSCQKQNSLATSSLTSKTVSTNDVGLPPPIIAWLKGPDVPIDGQGNPVFGLSNAFGFAINAKGYIGGGEIEFYMSFSPSNQLWEYDTVTRSWSQKANFPGDNILNASSFVIGNDAYVCTGGTSAPGVNFSKENWQYDQTANTWTRKSDFPGTARSFATATAINNKGYVGLGDEALNSTFPDTKDWWQYDPVTDSWTRKADFAGGKRGGAVSFTINNKGYVSCGHHVNVNTNNAKLFNDLWQYNPAGDSWKQKADLPASSRDNAIGLSVFGNKGIVGIVATGSASNDCWQYSASSNSWSQLPNVGGGPRSDAAGFSIGNTIYIGTGFVNSLTSSSAKDFWGLRLNP
jgi:N-acetylneuraminic acid mutarotase